MGLRVEYPRVTEIPIKREPISRDTFIDDLDNLVIEQEVDILDLAVGGIKQITRGRTLTEPD